MREPIVDCNESNEFGSEFPPTLLLPIIVLRLFSVDWLSLLADSAVVGVAPIVSRNGILFKDDGGVDADEAAWWWLFDKWCVVKDVVDVLLANELFDEELADGFNVELLFNENGEPANWVDFQLNPTSLAAKAIGRVEPGNFMEAYALKNQP